MLFEYLFDDTYNTYHFALIPDSVELGQADSSRIWFKRRSTGTGLVSNRSRHVRRCRSRTSPEIRSRTERVRAENDESYVGKGTHRGTVGIQIPDARILNNHYFRHFFVWFLSYNHATYHCFMNYHSDVT